MKISPNQYHEQQPPLQQSSPVNYDPIICQNHPSTDDKKQKKIVENENIDTS